MKDAIIRACCSVWRCTEAQLLGFRKYKSVSEARRVAAYYLRLKADLTPEEVAAVFSKSLPWASWAFYSVSDQAETDKAFASKCQSVELALKGIK